MSLLYLDTSAWLKIYVEETGTDVVTHAVNRAEIVCTHLLAYAELRAALARAEREQRITAVDRQQIVQAIDSHWPSMNIVQPTEILIRRAADLSERHELRGFDSIHLAAGEALALQVMPMPTLFASFDRKLNQAAKALGLEVLPLPFT